MVPSTGNVAVFEWIAFSYVGRNSVSILGSVDHIAATSVLISDCQAIGAVRKSGVNLVRCAGLRGAISITDFRSRS